MRRILLLSTAMAFGVPAAQAQPPGWEDIDLGGLTEIRASSGLAITALRAAPEEVAIGQAHFTGWVYNNDYAGPVLRVRPGDTVQIDLDNALPEPTNLHFHGLRVTPLGSGDNMHVSAAPGTTRRYRFRIPPGHPPGLFWFHDHLHGMTDKHVTAGLSGTILIDGFTQEFGGLDGVVQKLLVLKDYAEPDCTGALLKTMLHCRVISINGRENWADTLKPGTTQLWRIANEGADFIIHLAASGLRFRIIGRDGLPGMKAEDAAVLDVMPASRMDVLVTAAAPGGVALQALHVPTGSGAAFSANRQIGTITVAGPAASRAAVMPVFPLQRDLRGLPLNNRRTIVLSEDADALHYYIDGKLFAHDRIDVRVPLGTVEEWTVQNRTQDFHEFHIHQLGYQVTEINGVAQAFNGFVDDVNVPEMGEVKLLLPFTDPVILGKFMFHCHVLKHEDGGMMANIEVYRPEQGWTAPICHSDLDGGPALPAQSSVTPAMLQEVAAVLEDLHD